ncbi:MAG: CYTH domain-containing protein [Vicinamibacterales bacterium]
MHEIERKFLVVNDTWRAAAVGVLYRQGYLSSVTERVVRVRTAGSAAFLTIKGRTSGVTRLEFEYPIPLEDANRMLDELCERPLIAKTRYRVPWAGFTWDVDEFHEENSGLVIAEIELPSEATRFERPPWVGHEVSDDPRYFNTSLALRPFTTWEQT